jgi:aminoglycoside/choline kinase family phosphotransferase|tara:strand:+ start:20836 stop:21900 length:1065 start_codon:yes stop_codon:yes gene_type:complete
MIENNSGELIAWVREYLPKIYQRHGDLKLFPMRGDAGFRQYFRVNSEPSVIAVESPPSLENNLALVRVSSHFAEHNIRVPKIHAVDFYRGFFLLQDFGDGVVQTLLDIQNMRSVYTKAESIILDIQKLPKDDGIYPRYDGEMLRSEMNLFTEWFVNALLNIRLQFCDKKILENLFEILIESAILQPQVVVHKDYHSRNLMLLDNGELGVIDFQDALVGPITYDLVSLLKDCYLSWPSNVVEDRALNFMHCLLSHDLLVNESEADFLRSFDWMGLQRHIKVLGIFSRLALRDKKTGYLNDIPRVINYVLDVAVKYPALKAFEDWFRHRLLPNISSRIDFVKRRYFDDYDERVTSN